MFPCMEVFTEYSCVYGVVCGIHFCLQICIPNIFPHTELYSEFASLRKSSISSADAQLRHRGATTHKPEARI